MNRFRICFFVIMIVLLNLPSVTQAVYQIAPNPNPAGNTISITTSDAINSQSVGVFENFGTLDNSGTVKNSGWLSNNGTVTNNAGASLNNYLKLSNYRLLNNHGSLNNHGTLCTYTGASLNNHGKLDNYGVLTSEGNLLNYGILNNHTRSSLTNSGELQNYGTLNSYSTLSNSGRVINAGALNVDGTYTQTAGRTVNTGRMKATLLRINAGKLDGTGIINSRVTIGSVASVNPGVDGPPFGTLTINGPLDSSGILLFDICGSGKGKYDVLNIKGNTTFTGGTIQFNIQQYKGWHASPGDQWDFLFANNIKGWDTLDFAMNADAGLHWKIINIDGGKRLLITGTRELKSTPLPAAK